MALAAPPAGPRGQRRRPWLAWALAVWTLVRFASGASAGAAAAPEAAAGAARPARRGPARVGSTHPTAAPALEAWWRALPPPRRGTSFGQLVARAALVNLGRPYGDGIWGEPAQAAAARPPAEGWAQQQPRAPPDGLATAMHEPGRNAFNCVTFIEASLAVARCRWQGRPHAACFDHTVEMLRFRDGRRAGWPSQLHYFESWLADNQARGLLAPLTAALGGQPMYGNFFYMSQHPGLYPAMADGEARRSIAAQEDSLSGAPHLVISRDQLAAIGPQLRAGDIVSVVGSKPGLMITHTGFVHRGDDGHPRLLHASSAHGRVVLIPDRLEDYVMRRPERHGLVVVRPLSPPAP